MCKKKFSSNEKAVDLQEEMSFNAVRNVHKWAWHGHVCVRKREIKSFIRDIWKPQPTLQLDSANQHNASVDRDYRSKDFS